MDDGKQTTKKETAKKQDSSAVEDNTNRSNNQPAGIKGKGKAKWTKLDQFDLQSFLNDCC